jgi:putative FmdB family regulatory protein
MPVYEYDCKECGDEADVFHRIEDPVPPCEKCGGELKRVFRTPPNMTSVPGWAGKPIFSDKQIKDTHGTRWRETKNSHKAGGAVGAKQYFYR